MIRNWIVCAAALAFSTTGWAQGMSGAFAINPDVPGQYGFTFNRSSAKQAEGIALKNCGDGCEIYDVFVGGCGAYAVDAAQDGAVFGYATAGSSRDAREAAVGDCETRGGTACKAGKSGCNGRRPGRSK